MATHRRAIINTDAKNEGDDQYAIVHALLSPSLDVRGIIPAHFGTWRSDQSMIDSRQEVDLLLELLELSGRVDWLYDVMSRSKDTASASS